MYKFIAMVSITYDINNSMDFELTMESKKNEIMNLGYDLVSKINYDKYCILVFDKTFDIENDSTEYIEDIVKNELANFPLEELNVRRVYNKEDIDYEQ